MWVVRVSKDRYENVIARDKIKTGRVATMYADTEQEARQNALEDGDRFYLDETTLDEMLRLMIAEIERC